MKDGFLNWIHVEQTDVLWLALVNTAMNPLVTHKGAIFLSKWGS
jgi:hypothetical protein